MSNTNMLGLEDILQPTRKKQKTVKEVKRQFPWGDSIWFVDELVDMVGYIKISNSNSLFSIVGY